MKGIENSFRPLADRMRPRDLNEFVGQKHILGPGKPLYEAIEHQTPHSMVLWGPPGVGKTTLAHIISRRWNTRFASISAVTSGIKDIRSTVDEARSYREQSQQSTLLFVDEVHRFNKTQQDAFLPHIEDGTLIFIGATTENPAFELNNALLSRARTYVLKAVAEEDLIGLIQRVLADEERGLAKNRLKLSEQQQQWLARAGDGDARRMLNFLELASDLAEQREGEDTDSVCELGDELLQQIFQEGSRRFDKGGDAFYEQISALHKAVRGSSPDAALYWLARMLDGGCDPVYIARRLVRMASEDIGNADPRALEITLNCWESYTRLGSPEGELALAQATAYLASSAKSNAVYAAFGAARAAVVEHGSLEVPLHLRNASTSLTKGMGYGKEYRYAHEESDGFAAGENYLPEALADARFYFPVTRGLEEKIAQKLEHLEALNKASVNQRYNVPKK